MKRILLIAHNLRSVHNVGSLIRTAEGLGLEAIYLTGYTPYPSIENDPRLPHLARKITNQIHKTALDAETMIKCSYHENIEPVINELRSQGFKIIALEQTAEALNLAELKPPAKMALVVGNETDGLTADILSKVDKVVQITMLGKKESFNVVQAAAMALYHCRFMVQ